MPRKEKKWPLYVMRVIAIVSLAGFLLWVVMALWSQAQLNRMLDIPGSPPSPSPASGPDTPPAP